MVDMEAGMEEADSDLVVQEEGIVEVEVVEMVTEVLEPNQVETVAVEATMVEEVEEMVVVVEHFLVEREGVMVEEGSDLVVQEVVLAAVEVEEMAMVGMVPC